MLGGCVAMPKIQGARANCDPYPLDPIELADRQICLSYRPLAKVRTKSFLVLVSSKA
jgi:hypothetical protein